MEKTTIEFKKSTLWKGLAGILTLVAIFMVFNGNLSFTGTRGTAPAGNVVAAPDNEIVEVKTVLQNYQYNPAVITLKKGSKVRLTVENKDNVVHGLHLPQFGIFDSQPPNSVKTVEFTAIETPLNGQALPTCTESHGERLTINVV